MLGSFTCKFFYKCILCTSLSKFEDDNWKNVLQPYKNLRIHLILYELSLWSEWLNPLSCCRLYTMPDFKMFAFQFSKEHRKPSKSYESIEIPSTFQIQGMHENVTNFNYELYFLLWFILWSLVFPCFSDSELKFDINILVFPFGKYNQISN